MSASSPDLLTGLLRSVSRSFYLTLRVLPWRLRQPIGLAYLLARTSDTLADTALLPAGRRREALAELCGRIVGHHARPLGYQAFLPHQASGPEREALDRVEESLALLEAQSPDDRAAIRDLLEIIISGQELDLQRFERADPGRVIALATDSELDDYTWRVAGCVGQFWTRLCRRHLFPNAPLDDCVLESEGIRFGKGLQLINILRDLAADLHQGRCYLPEERLTRAGLRPDELLNPAVETRVRAVIEPCLTLAGEHLAAGWDYTNRLPRDQWRLRLACAWPILIGAQTLTRLRAAPLLDPRHRVKISRAEVRRIVVSSIIRLGNVRAWRRQFAAASSDRAPSGTVGPGASGKDRGATSG